jgi:hypothetical protein
VDGEPGACAQRAGDGAQAGAAASSRTGTQGGRLVFSRAALAKRAGRVRRDDSPRRAGPARARRAAGAGRCSETYALRSSAIGEIERTRERFTHDRRRLGGRGGELDRPRPGHAHSGPAGHRRSARVDAGRRWCRTSWSTSLHRARLPLNVYRILTRIKAEEEIWNKVVDELFDAGLHRAASDKQLQPPGAVRERRVRREGGGGLRRRRVPRCSSTAHRAGVLAWSTWRREGCPPTTRFSRLEFVESKDYLQRPSRKQSGWSALKSVVHWAGRTFEIQVQPLSNFLHERERLTRESHASFKGTRERVRDEVAQRLPLCSGSTARCCGGCSSTRRLRRRGRKASTWCWSTDHGCAVPPPPLLRRFKA